MNLKDTCSIELKDSQHLTRLLYVLLSEESKATEQYAQVIDALGKQHESVRKSLEEIRNDELNHVGILIKQIADLNPEAARAMLEGADEGK